MINREFVAIDKATIESLLTNLVPESRSLEYKRDRVGSTGAERKEFLYDIAAMANAGGGDLVLGISEKREGNKETGIPEAIDGIDLNDTTAAAEMTRLETMMRDGIAPRVRVRTNAINDFPRGPVLLLRVSESLNGPHMVTIDKTNKFYSRTSSGKFIMDVDQIREAFSMASSYADRARQFRTERVESVVGGSCPIQVLMGPSILLHIIPISAFSQSNGVDPRQAKAINMLPLSEAANIRRFNVDGFLAAHTVKGKCYSYLQVFRSGVIEAFHVLKWQDPESQHGSTRRWCYFELTEGVVMKWIVEWLSNLSTIGAGPPLAIALSGIHLNGVGLTNSCVYNSEGLGIFDRSEILLPEAWVEEACASLRDQLKPCFEAFWQSAGYEVDPVFEGHADRMQLSFTLPK